MSQPRPFRLAARSLALVLLLVPASCAELDEGEDAGADVYEPSHVQPIEGSDLLRVTFTSEGADAVDLATEKATRSGRHTVIDYAALIYDGQGLPWVYTVASELTFVRAPVVVDSIDGERVLLVSGLAAGTEVVTTGAAEVYGTELDIAGTH